MDQAGLGAAALHSAEQRKVETSSRQKSGQKHTAPVGFLLFIHLLGCCSECQYPALEDLSFFAARPGWWKANGRVLSTISDVSKP